jgi:hypothetical protein
VRLETSHHTAELWKISHKREKRNPISLVHVSLAVQAFPHSTLAAPAPSFAVAVRTPESSLPAVCAERRFPACVISPVLAGLMLCLSLFYEYVLKGTSMNLKISSDGDWQQPNFKLRPENRPNFITVPRGKISPRPVRAKEINR